jgi:hypothetical protein
MRYDTGEGRIMVQQPDINTIRREKEKLLATAARYDALAAKARAEAADYEAAERVWLKLVSEPPDIAMIEGKITSEGTDQGKPLGIPTLPEMIIEAMRADNGGGGIQPSAALSFIRQKYWPTVKGADVSSTMWRMAQEGRLFKPMKNAPVYRLPQDKENAA